MNDEFYIGWQNQAPPRTARLIRRFIILLLLIILVLAALFSLWQRTIGSSVFEWGKVKEFSGILKSEPYPRLLVPRPGAKGANSQFSSYSLVNRFKFGLPRRLTAQYDGQPVTLRGTLIYRGNQTMIEVLDTSIQAAPHLKLVANDEPMHLGKQTLVGEIVDSKCFLGVMNPGALTTHRACAIRCISGGIPPVLLVRQASGNALYFLLVSSEGKPVNKEILNLVAEPVRITGEVERQGDLLILRADPSTYRRL